MPIWIETIKAPWKAEDLAAVVAVRRARAPTLGTAFPLERSRVSAIGRHSLAAACTASSAHCSLRAAKSLSRARSTISSSSVGGSGVAAEELALAAYERALAVQSNLQ